MKVLHFSSAMYPFQNGGTEAFIEDLLNKQKLLKEISDLIWAIHDENDMLHSKQNSLSNHKKIIASISSNRFESFSGDCSNVDSFEELLRNFSPNIVHLHDFNFKCGIKHAKAAKKYNCKLIISIHTPICSCLGSGLFYKEPKLNGKFNDQVCTANTLHEKGLPMPLAYLFSLQNLLSFNPESVNSFSKVLSMRQRIHQLHVNYKSYLDIADKIHVCANWTGELLQKQGVPQSKIILIRAGISEKIFSHKRKLIEDGILKLVFFGRCEKVKGIDMIIKAIKKLNNKLQIRLDIYTSNWSGEFCRSLNKLIEKDRRFNVYLNFQKDQIQKKLKGYDLVVIPSIWLETGPLVSLEALSARIPIAATDRGGPKEILKDLDNCYLVKPNIKSWSQLLLKIIQKKGQENEVKCLPKHNFEDVAKLMLENLY